MRRAHHTVLSVHSTQYSVHSIQCIVYTVRCTVYSTQYIFPLFHSQFTQQYVLHIYLHFRVEWTILCHHCYRRRHCKQPLFLHCWMKASCIWLQLSWSLAVSNHLFPLNLVILSAHLDCGLPGFLWVVGFHLVKSRAQLSFILATWPAHFQLFLTIVSTVIFDGLVCDMVLPFDS